MCCCPIRNDRKQICAYSVDVEPHQTPHHHGTLVSRQRSENCNNIRCVQQTKSEFLEKFSLLRAVVLDEGGMFSGSKVFAELLECERIARQIGEESIELAQVLSLMSQVQWKRDRPEDTIEFALGSLAIQVRIGPLPVPEPFYPLDPGSFATTH